MNFEYGLSLAKYGIMNCFFFTPRNGDCWCLRSLETSTTVPCATRCYSSMSRVEQLQLPCREVWSNCLLLDGCDVESWRSKEWLFIHCVWKISSYESYVLCKDVCVILIDFECTSKTFFDRTDTWWFNPKAVLENQAFQIRKNGIGKPRCMGNLFAHLQGEPWKTKPGRLIMSLPNDRNLVLNILNQPGFSWYSKTNPKNMDKTNMTKIWPKQLEGRLPNGGKAPWGWRYNRLKPSLIVTYQGERYKELLIFQRGLQGKRWGCLDCLQLGGGERLPRRITSKVEGCKWWVHYAIVCKNRIYTYDHTYLDVSITYHIANVLMMLFFSLKLCRGATKVEWWSSSVNHPMGTVSSSGICTRYLPFQLLSSMWRTTPTVNISEFLDEFLQFFKKLFWRLVIQWNCHEDLLLCSYLVSNTQSQRTAFACGFPKPSAISR